MFYASKLMAEYGVKAVFSDCDGGVSKGEFESLNLGFDLGDAKENVSSNLKRFCAATDFPIPHQAKQVHASHALFCKGVGQMHSQSADILITSSQGVSVAVRTADCLPILLADKQAGIVAAAHAGWKGTVAKVAEKAVANMCKLGAKPQSIVASLGPCIGSCCFEVDAYVSSALNKSCGESVSQDALGKVFSDIAKANMLQLKKSGVLTENIEVSSACTVCQKNPEYFSYRRGSGQAGRQLSMIGLV